MVKIISWFGVYYQEKVMFVDARSFGDSLVRLQPRVSVSD